MILLWWWWWWCCRLWWWRWRWVSGNGGGVETVRPLIGKILLYSYPGRSFLFRDGTMRNLRRIGRVPSDFLADFVTETVPYLVLCIHSSTIYHVPGTFYFFVLKIPPWKSKEDLALQIINHLRGISIVSPGIQKSGSAALGHG